MRQNRLITAIEKCFTFDAIEIDMVFSFCAFSECIRVIGEDLLIEAYSIIDNQPEDFVEVCN